MRAWNNQRIQSVLGGLITLTWSMTPVWAQLSAVERAPVLRYFPLTKGSYWIYEGRVRWTPVGLNVVQEEHVVIRMEVTDTYQRGPVWFALLNGHPADAAWYEPQRLPSHGAALCVGYQVYFVDASRVPEVRRRVQDPHDRLGGLVKSSDVDFDFPLLPGKQFGETEQLTREDVRYQWIVLSPSTVLTAIGESVPHQSELLYETVPAHIRLRFEDGKGIVGYESVHHGTVAEAYLALKEFRISAGDER